ncbi:uncharacterized protein Z518_09442 [Rhinocladiella mackenziei CBS 650.93]|uniref:Thiamine pyrophosphate enzyme central domain-containing protein n=1 Tax=Rhinocladiella mackenziei CBS 650.93 TaxID=1442369 RepID=A0A0D2IEN3_9EURO|nr:uncharacterized protein Z518_09442 [Rhinocladiella mackenziei CBS 650.93]KIX01716.1 hypothetical protein Z518_09442 [Rhinocladiella mackenziei CBS 650.93]
MSLPTSDSGQHDNHASYWICLQHDKESAETDDYQTNQLLSRVQLPSPISPLAQGFFDESVPNFGGVYTRKGSNPRMQHFVEESDLVLHLGALDADATSYLGSTTMKEATTIRLLPEEVVIGASFGIFDTRLLQDNLLIGSAQRAALVAGDDNGSFQPTCQEISTMIKQCLQAIMWADLSNFSTNLRYGS